jgi:hypothetical protein
MSEWKQIEHHLLSGVDELFMTIIHLGGSGDTESDAWSDFVDACKERYESGRAEHEASDSTWDGWSDEEFEKNIREELMDAVIYTAARNIRLLRGAA